MTSPAAPPNQARTIAPQSWRVVPMRTPSASSTTGGPSGASASVAQRTSWARASLAAACTARPTMVVVRLAPVERS